MTKRRDTAVRVLAKEFGYLDLRVGPPTPTLIFNNVGDNVGQQFGKIVDIVLAAMKPKKARKRPK